MPEAIKALNVEAGRLLGWIHSPAEVVAELGYTVEEAEKLFMSSQKILASGVKLLEVKPVETPETKPMEDFNL